MKPLKRKEWADWHLALRHNVWFVLGGSLIIAGLLVSGASDFLPAAKATHLTGEVVALFGGLFVCITGFGFGTVRAFRRTYDHICEHDNRLGEKYQKVIHSQIYCARAGVRAAAIALGRAGDLTPRIANPWIPF